MKKATSLKMLAQAARHVPSVIGPNIRRMGPLVVLFLQEGCSD